MHSVNCTEDYLVYLMGGKCWLLPPVPESQVRPRPAGGLPLPDEPPHVRGQQGQGRPAQAGDFPSV